MVGFRADGLLIMTGALGYGDLVLSYKVQTSRRTAGCGFAGILPLLVAYLVLLSRHGEPLPPALLSRVHLMECAAAPESIGWSTIPSRGIGIFSLFVSPVVLLVVRRMPVTTVFICFTVIILVASIFVFIFLTDLIVFFDHIFLALPIGSTRSHTTRLLDCTRVLEITRYHTVTFLVILAGVIIKTLIHPVDYLLVGIFRKEFFLCAIVALISGEYTCASFTCPRDVS